MVSPIAETTTTTSLPALLGVHHAPGDALDAVSIRHRGTAELLHNELLGDGGRNGQLLRLRSGLDFGSGQTHARTLTGSSGFWARQPNGATA